MNTKVWHHWTSPPGYFRLLSTPSVTLWLLSHIPEMCVGRRRENLAVRHCIIERIKEMHCFIILAICTVQTMKYSLKKTNHLNYTHLILNLRTLKTMRTIWNSNEFSGGCSYITASGKYSNLGISENKKGSDSLHQFSLVNFLQQMVGNEFLTKRARH